MLVQSGILQMLISDTSFLIVRWTGNLHFKEANLCSLELPLRLEKFNLQTLEVPRQPPALSTTDELQEASQGTP